MMMSPASRAALCLSLCLIFSHGARAAELDRVLVIVNNDAITLSEYRARHQREILQGNPSLAELGGEIYPPLLDAMVTERIQLQFANARRLRVDPREIDAGLQFIAEQNNASVDELLRELARRDVNAQQFRASLRNQRLIQLLVDSAVNSRVAVGENEIDSYLQNRPELVDSDASFEISRILAPREALAELRAVRDELLQGGDFARAAKQFSDNEAYLGWRDAGQLPEIFVRALRATEIGGVSEIIVGENALHLLKLHAKKAGETLRQYQVRHILLRASGNDDADVRDRAAALRAQIIGGEPFEKAARLHSEDRGTAFSGGLLGWLGARGLPPRLATAVAELAVGELSQPLRSAFGWHLLQVLQHRDVNRAEANAREDARRAVFQRKAAEIYEEWITVLRGNAYIEYVDADPT